MKFSSFIVSCLLTTSFSTAFAQELLHPFTDEMALEAGLTPVEDVSRVRKAKPTQAQIDRLLQENRVVILINKAASGVGAQTLTMYENGAEVLHTKVSTGSEKRVTSTSGRSYITTTPVGHFRPTKIYTDYFSYTWQAPMPNPVFFIGGIAIHATGEANYRLFGTRASGGCVRVSLENSKLIRETVMDSGKGSVAGQYVLVKEATKRMIVTKNAVEVPALDRNTGKLLNSKIQSWDTAIVVYQ